MKNLNRNEFLEAVKAAKKPLVVDFWAEWCGPCRMLAPVFEQAEAELKGKMDFAKLNVDEEQQTAMELGISNIPCLIVFKNGKAVNKIIGLRDKQELVRLLKESI